MEESGGATWREKKNAKAWRREKDKTSIDEAIVLGSFMSWLT